MPVEVELKYRAEGPAPLRALETARSLGSATLGEARTVEEIDRYLETDDGRLAAARWACRLRSREGTTRVSLKGPPEAGSGATVHRRPEIEGPATDSVDPADWPPSDARAFLDRVRDGHPLLERFRLRQQRTERSVRVGESALGTLTLDVVGIEAERRSRGTIHVVELELHADGHPDDEARLQRMATALESLPGLEPDPRTKLEHALERIAGP